MERRHLKIKLDAFLTALELALDGGDGGWFLDLQSREILLAGDGTEVGLEDVDDDERYLMIGPIASKTGFRMMDEFVAGISDASAAGRLGAWTLLCAGANRSVPSRTRWSISQPSAPPGSPSSKPPAASRPTTGARTTALRSNGRRGMVRVLSCRP
jgi:hypothetical protein